MNTQFNSNVIWLQLEYKISTLVDSLCAFECPQSQAFIIQILLEKGFHPNTKALRFTSHQQPENLWNPPLFISYTLDFPIWFVFCITLSRKQDFNFLSLYIFFLGKKPSYFYSCHAFETTICEFTWYITYKMYVYGILANNGLTSFLKEHLIILLIYVFTKHLIK